MLLLETKFCLLSSFKFRLTELLLITRFREIIQKKRDNPEDPPTDFLQIYLSNYEQEGSKNDISGKLTNKCASIDSGLLIELKVVVKNIIYDPHNKSHLTIVTKKTCLHPPI